MFQQSPQQSSRWVIYKYRWASPPVEIDPPPSQPLDLQWREPPLGHGLHRSLSFSALVANVSPQLGGELESSRPEHSTVHREGAPEDPGPMLEPRLPAVVALHS